MRDLASLTAADFEQALDSDFQTVDGHGNPVALRLTEVIPLPQRPGHRRPFSLRFRGPLSSTLEQVTHRFVHAGLGELDLFLGPIAADSDGIVYEAVFA
jgi:hypothetical protein